MYLGREKERGQGGQGGDPGTDMMSDPIDRPRDSTDGVRTRPPPGSPLSAKTYAVCSGKCTPKHVEK